MDQVVIPQEIEPKIKAIFAEPGRQWTPEEKQQVIDWLHEQPQLIRILLTAARCCQRYNYEGDAARQRAEDLWQEFCTPRQRRNGDRNSQLDIVIESYDPTREKAMPFLNYLLFCFQKLCQNKLRAEIRGPIVVPINDEEEGEGSDTEKESIDPRPSPEKEVEVKEFLAVLKRCLERLPDNHRTVFIQYHIDGLSYEEIATSLNKPLGTIKGWLHRARQKLRECLREEI